MGNKVIYQGNYALILGGAQGFKFNSNDIVLEYGASTPEGAIAAPVGSVFINNTTGEIWSKETGVGNTGWVLINTSGATQEPTGFPVLTTGLIDRTSSVPSFVDGTRTFSLNPSAVDFDFFVRGVKYTSTGDSIVISATEGMHFIYYDSTGTIQESTVWNDAYITANAFIAGVYWDNTNSQQIYLGDERHGCQMPGHTHLWIHENEGTSFVSGQALNTLSTDQDGSLAAHAQFGVDSGEIRDEDITVTLAAILSTTGLPIYYKDGAAGDWRRSINAGFPVVTTGTGRLAWNEDTGAVWQLTEVSNLQFVLYHIFSTNDTTYPYIAIMGQADYNVLINARAGANIEISNLVTSGLPFNEFVPIATVIYQTADAYANAVNARIRTTDLGDDYIDWRFSQISPIGSTVTNHKNLSNLDYANSGHTGFARALADWTTITNYVVNDTVTYLGIIYRALVTHTSGATFPADVALSYWQIIETDDLGIQGRQGAEEIDGIVNAVDTDIQLLTLGAGSFIYDPKIIINNRNNAVVRIRVAIIDGALGAVANEDYFEYDTQLQPKEMKPLKFPVIPESYTILVRSDTEYVNFSCFGTLLALDRGWRRLAASSVVADTDTALYTATGQVDDVFIVACNRDPVNSANISLAAIDGAIGTWADEDNLLPYEGELLTEWESRYYNLEFSLANTHVIGVRSTEADVHFIAFGRTRL